MRVFKISRSAVIGLNLLFSAPVGASPIEIVPGPLNSGKIYVPCAFDGVQRSCFLDTGGAFSALSFDGFSSKYPAAGQFQYTSASGKPAAADSIIVGKLVSCGVQMEGAKIARFPEGASGEDSIGVDLFSGARITFDFQSRTIEVGKSTPPGLNLQKLQIHPKGIFSIPLSIGLDISLLGFWDTGAGLSAIDETVIAQYPEQFNFVADIPQGTDATGASVPLKLYRIKTLKIGNLSLDDNYILSLNFSPIRKYIGDTVSVIVGFNLISQYNWYFDLQEQTWGVSAFSSEPKHETLK